MKSPSGAWVGWGLGDVDPKVADIQAFLARKFRATAGSLVATGTYDQATADVVAKLQRNLGTLTPTGIFNYATQLALGYIKATPTNSPLFFTVEGHMSDMRAGPVADTADELEKEGKVRWQPTGYDSNALPFDNKSGVDQLVQFYSYDRLPDGRPFPRGTKSIIGGFSQGMIVVYDFVSNYLMPGQSLDWRTPDILGVLAYGNPCRQTGSIAPWSVAQAGDRSSGGLDPKRRFGLPNNPDAPPVPWQDVWRHGDIFTDNSPDKTGQMKAAVYEAVARSDFFGSQFSLAAEIANLFKAPVADVLAIFKAIISGIGFAANQANNPHYSPFDISGGLNWTRSLLG